MKRLALALVASGLGMLLYAAPQAARADAGIGTIACGTSVDANEKITDPTTDFAARTPVIVCAWTTKGIEQETVIRGVWIAENVGDAAPPNYKIDEASVKLAADGRGQFSLSKPDKGFPMGKYRVEIYFNKDLVKTVRFNVAK